MDKYKEGKYRKCYFRGGSNSHINLITCEYKIVILSIIQGYLLNWYHTYLLHPQMDRTKAMIFQHFYWHGIIYTVRKEVTNCGTFQQTNLSNKKYSKLPAKESEETLQNKLCLYPIFLYFIRRKGKK